MGSRGTVFTTETLEGEDGGSGMSDTVGGHCRPVLTEPVGTVFYTASFRTEIEVTKQALKDQFLTIEVRGPRMLSRTL
jgi:hypothetical protein